MKLLKFGRNQSNEAREREIDEVLASPAWQAMRMAADKTNVETRAELKQRLDTLNERFDKEIEQAGVKCQEAERYLEDLRKRTQAQIREAEEALVAARSAAWTLENNKNKEEFNTRNELYASRDTRGDEFFEHLGNARSMINHFVRTWPKIIGYHPYSGTAIYGSESNNKEVLAALDLIKGAQKRLEEMALLPLSRVDIDERLNSISRELAPTLQKFSQPCPVLNADGEVELSTPRLRTYYALQAAGAATKEDTQQVNVLAAGGSVLGERGARRVRSARAGMINALGRSTQWMRNLNDLDDIESK
ncbi:hypothetical protein WK18_18140 [Burkholderia ubonensis]|uniref:hypothetical protein n=1 Tax=Burkholderia ubonensis TaxID=101571 RepID=UPI00075F5D25|nr:hypothetical protein [Burkholderia ubonensis]KVR43361.1 hypothetical protein WK18_18140 [Burkholderia ubonensis]KWB80174.1 hypothetical protein WL41_00610 [Burkholderia ubonensis]